MTTEYDGCPNCGRTEAEATRHCNHERCDQLECNCGRFYADHAGGVGTLWNRQ